ncbi:MAG: tetratricopeptide repeat protein [Chloroflexi bacterium]|nr:tetratricopeptide repeat protein [Chloroflexota bacterium]MCL5075903.1 tetratricopeptide repeat protein [Chloroflexota bacterium]
MPTLETHIEGVKAAILAGNTDQAIATCQYLLRYFPKYIEVHCLLAEAYRDKGLIEPAEDLFKRVLSADPDNVIAHWALSLIYEEHNDLNRAVRERQRALDVSPGHQELQRELLRLTSQKPKPTRGGLGRLYIRGGLYEQAIAEFKTILDKEPDRLDVRLSLAEALWWAGRAAEAATVCAQILEDSPDCLKANLICGWEALKTGEAEKGEALLQRAQALDPENKVAASLISDERFCLRTIEIPPADEMAMAFPSAVVVTSALDQAPPESGRATEPPQERKPADYVAEAGVSPAEPIIEEMTLPLEVTESVADKGESEDQATPSTEDETEPLVMAEEHPPIEEATESMASKSEIGDQAAPPTEMEPLTVVEEHPPTEAVTEEEILSTALPPESILSAVQETLEEIAIQRSELEALAEKTEEELPTPSAEAEEGMVVGEATILSQEEDTLSKTVEEPPALLSVENSTTSAQVEIGGDVHSVVEEEDDDLSAAIQPYLERVRADPNDYAARLALGNAYQQLGQVDLAIEEYRQVIKGAPYLVEAVVDNLKWLIYSRPDHAESHRTLGDAYMKVGRFQQAVEEYNWTLHESSGEESSEESSD